MNLNITCEDKCGTDDNVICSCCEDCERKNNCCPDYHDFCISTTRYLRTTPAYITT